MRQIRQHAERCSARRKRANNLRCFGQSAGHPSASWKSYLSSGKDVRLVTANQDYFDKVSHLSVTGASALSMVSRALTGAPSWTKTLFSGSRTLNHAGADWTQHHHSSFRFSIPIHNPAQGSQRRGQVHAILPGLLLEATRQAARSAVGQLVLCRQRHSQARHQKRDRQVLGVPCRGRVAKGLWAGEGSCFVLVTHLARMASSLTVSDCTSLVFVFSLFLCQGRANMTHIFSAH